MGSAVTLVLTFLVLASSFSIQKTLQPGNVRLSDDSTVNVEPAKQLLRHWAKNEVTEFVLSVNSAREDAGVTTRLQTKAGTPIFDPIRQGFDPYGNLCSLSEKDCPLRARITKSQFCTRTSTEYSYCNAYAEEISVHFYLVYSRRGEIVREDLHRHDFKEYRILQHAYLGADLELTYDMFIGSDLTGPGG